MAAAAQTVNFLTGISGEFLTYFRGLRTESVSRAEIPYHGILPHILQVVFPGDTQINVRRKRVEDLSGGFHEEVLRLLQLGAGTVTIDGEILLVPDIIEMMYASKEAAREILAQILQGIQTALDAHVPRNPDIQLTVLMRDLRAEIGRLHSELDH
jgi:hypothetical protein